MFDLSILLTAAIIVLSVVLLVVAPYAVTRYFFRRHAEEDTGTLSSSIIFRTASLHGLILALVFAQEQVNVVDLRRTTAREAAAVADIFYDLNRYDSVGNQPLRRALAEYVRIVISEEWEALADGHLSQRAWDLWDEVYTGILDFHPKDPRQEALRERMLHDIETISESRNIRSADSASGVTALFWFVAILGIVFVVLPYFVFPARKVNLLLLGSFAAYNGVVIFTILSLTNPYSPPRAVTPGPFVEIFNGDMKTILATDQKEQPAEPGANKRLHDNP